MPEPVTESTPTLEELQRQGQMIDPAVDGGLRPMTEDELAARPSYITQPTESDEPELTTDLSDLRRALPSEGPGSLNYYIENIRRARPEFTSDQVEERAAAAAAAYMRQTPDPDRERFSREMSLLESAEAINLTEYARRVGSLSSDVPVQQILSDMAEEAGMSPDQYIAIGQQAGYNFEGMARDIRERGMNPNAVVRLSSVRGEPGYAVNAEVAARRTEGARRVRETREAIESGDIESLMEIDDPRIEIVGSSSRTARSVSAGSPAFDELDRYVTQLLVNPEMNLVYQNASFLTSSNAMQRYADDAVEVYLNRFGLSPDDRLYGQARAYFYKRAVDDVAAIVAVGRWPGSTILTDDLMNRILGTADDVQLGDSGLFIPGEVRGLVPEALGGSSSRMQVVGMSADGFPLMAPVENYIAFGEMVDKPGSYFAGIARGALEGDITDLASFSEAGLRGMGSSDTGMNVGLDYIGDNPNLSTTEQAAIYLAGTGAYVLSPDTLTFVGGLLGKGVKAAYRGVRLRPVREVNRLTEQAARARLSGNFEEATRIESELRRVSGRGTEANLAGQIDADDARLAQRFSQRGVEGAEDIMGPGADELDEILMMDDPVHRHASARRQALTDSETGEMRGGFEGLLNPKRALDALDELELKYEKGLLTPEGARALRAVEEDIANLAVDLEKLGITDPYQQRLVEDLLRKQLSRNPSNVDGIVNSVDDLVRGFPETADDAVEGLAEWARGIAQKGSDATEGAPSLDQVLGAIERARTAVRTNNEIRAVAMGYHTDYTNSLLGNKRTGIDLAAAGAREAPEVHPLRPMTPQAIDFFDRLRMAGVVEETALDNARVLDELVRTLASRQGRDANGLWELLGGIEVRRLAGMADETEVAAVVRAVEDAPTPSAARPTPEPAARPTGRRYIGGRGPLSAEASAKLDDLRARQANATGPKAERIQAEIDELIGEAPVRPTPPAPAPAARPARPARPARLGDIDPGPRPARPLVSPETPAAAPFGVPQRIALEPEGQVSRVLANLRTQQASVVEESRQIIPASGARQSIREAGVPPRSDVEKLSPELRRSAFGTDDVDEALERAQTFVDLDRGAKELQATMDEVARLGDQPVPGIGAMPSTADEAQQEISSLVDEFMRLEGPQGRRMEASTRNARLELIRDRVRKIEDEVLAVADEMQPMRGALPEPKPSGIPGLTVEEFTEIIEGFEDGRAAARYLAGSADSPAARLVAARIEPHLDNVQIRVLKPGDPIPVNYGNETLGAILRPGQFSAVKQAYGVSDEVELILLTSAQANARYAGTNVETLLHELVHSATVNRLVEGITTADSRFNKVRQLNRVRNVDQTRPLRKSPLPRARMLGDDVSDLSRAAIELEDLATGPVATALREYHLALEPGGLRLGQDPWNVYELVSYALTNKPFQDFLAGIKIAGTDETILSRFTQIVMRLLGFSPNERTALSEVIRLTDNLLNAESKALTGRTAADTLIFAKGADDAAPAASETFRAQAQQIVEAQGVNVDDFFRMFEDLVTRGQADADSAVKTTLETLGATTETAGKPVDDLVDLAKIEVQRLNDTRVAPAAVDEVAAVAAPVLSPTQVQNRVHLALQRNVEVLEARLASTTQAVHKEQAALEALVPQKPVRASILNQATQGIDPSDMRVTSRASDDGRVLTERTLTEPELELAGRAQAHVSNKRQISDLRQGIDEEREVIAALQRTVSPQRAEVAEELGEELAQEAADLQAVVKRRDAVQRRMAADEAELPGSATDLDRELLSSLNRDIDVIRSGQMSDRELDQLKRYRDLLQKQVDDGVEGADEAEVAILSQLIDRVEGRAVRRAQAEPLPRTELQQARSEYAESADALTAAKNAEREIDDAIHVLGDEIGAARARVTPEPLPPAVQARVDELDDLINKMEETMDLGQEVSPDGTIFTPRFPGRQYGPTRARETTRLPDDPDYGFEAWTDHQRLRYARLQQERADLIRPRNLATDSAQAKQQAAFATTMRVQLGQATDLALAGEDFRAQVLRLRVVLPAYHPDYTAYRGVVQTLLKRVDDGQITNIDELRQSWARARSQFVDNHPEGPAVAVREIQEGEARAAGAIIRNRNQAADLARTLDDPLERLNRHGVDAPEHPQHAEFASFVESKRKAATRTDEAFLRFDAAEESLDTARKNVMDYAARATEPAEIEEAAVVLRPGPPRPSSMNATNLQFYEDGKAILYLFVTEGDPGRLVEELGKIVTRMLGPEDMDQVVAWLGKRGVNITHRNGRFIGDAATVARAEDYFGEALERYIRTGENTDSRMTRIFTTTRDAIGNVYRAVTRSGIKPTPEIDDFFSKVLPKVAGSDGIAPVTRNAVLKQVFDEDQEMGQVSAIGLIEAEARRLGMPFDKEATLRNMDDLFKGATADNPIGQNIVVTLAEPIRFPELAVLNPKFAQPRTTFTLQEIAQLDQALKTNRMALQHSRNMAVSFRGRKALIEGSALTPDQMIDEIFSRYGEMGVGQRVLFGGPFGRVSKAVAIGGDVDRHMRSLTPYARGLVRAGDRSIKQMMGDLGRIIYEGSRTNQRGQIYAFLGGEPMAFTRGGRQALSSGEDFMDATRDNIRMVFEAIDPKIKSTLTRYLEDTRRAYDEGGLGAVGEMFAGRGPYALNRAQADDARRLISQLTAREGFQSTNMMSMFRNALEIAEQPVKGKTGRAILNDPNKMALFLESVAYAGGQTRRGPIKTATAFAGSSAERAQTLIEDFRNVLFLGADPAKIPTEISQLYEVATNSFATVVGTVGAGRNVKLRWVGQGIAVPVDAYDGLRRMMMGLPVDPNQHAGLFAMSRRLGTNIEMLKDDFVQGRVTIKTEDGVSQLRMQDTGFVLPAVARQRLAAAMKIATPDPERLINPTFFGGSQAHPGGVEDVFAFVHNQYKIQLIRGRGMLKQGYFTMNTMDNVVQTAAVTNKQGFRLAIANLPRVFLQNVMSVPGALPLFGFAETTALFTAATGTFAIEKASAAAARFGVGPGRIKAAERLRELLSGAGDVVGERLAKIARIGAADIRVSDVMTLKRPYVRIGDTVYETSSIRRDAVEAGVMASFDTRQLSTGLKNSGRMLRRSLQRQADAATEAGDIRRLNAIHVTMDTFADYFRHLDDAAEAWSERERLGLMITMMGAGFDSKTAARMTVDALFDYAGSMTAFEQNILINAAVPFWAYVKNANRRVLNLLCSARGAYKLGVLRRGLDAGPESIQWLLYEGLVDPYGMDVDSMTVDEQEAYFSFISMLENGMFANPAEIDALDANQRSQVERLIFTDEERLGDPENNIAPKTFDDLTDEQIDRLLNGYNGLPPRTVREQVRQMFLGNPTLYLEQGKAYTRSEMIDLAAQSQLYHPNTLMYEVVDTSRAVPRPNPAAYGRYTRGLPGFTFTMPMVDEMSRYIETVQRSDQGKEGISIAGNEAPFLHVVAPPDLIQGAYTHFLAQAASSFLLAEAVVSTGQSLVRGGPDLSDEVTDYDPEGTTAEYQFFVGGEQYTVSRTGSALIEQLEPIVDLGRMPTVELVRSSFEDPDRPSTAPVRVSRAMHLGMQDMGLLSGLTYEVSTGQVDPYDGTVIEHPRYYVSPGTPKLIYRLTPILADYNRHTLRSELSEIEGALEQSEDERVQSRLMYLELLRFAGFRVVQEIGSKSAYQMGFDTEARSLEAQSRQINR